MPVTAGNQGTSATGSGTLLVAIPLTLIVFAAFLPTLDNGFVNWDDDKNFLDNPFFRGCGFAHLKWAATTLWLGVYQPFAWFLFELQFVCWKLDPRGYHLTSLILHSANTVVLYFLSLALLARTQADSSQQPPWSCLLGAGLATALFAVHPLRVEAVAWASCQPYLPCALFSMLSVLAYLRSFPTNASPRSGWLVVAFALFVAALLSHAVAVTLPVVFLILDVYPLRRFGDQHQRWFTPQARKIWLQKLLFLAPSVIFVILAIAARRQSLGSVERNDASASVAQSCYGIWFYIVKTVVPLKLIAVYPAPKTINWLAPTFLISILATMAMTMGLLLMRQRWPGLMAGWLSYLVILAPNSGLIRINDQIAADRYSYISMLGLVVVLAGCICRPWSTPARLRPVMLGMIAIGLGLLPGLVFLSRDQCRTWRDSERLWAHALDHGAAESSLAHYNMALVLYRQGKLSEAAAHDAVALRLNPGDVVVHNNLGTVLERQGKLEAAAARYTEALRLNPEYLDAHYNLGIVLSRQGKFKEAAEHYGQVLRLNPGFAAAHDNLGVDLFREGKLAEAAARYTEALRLNPERVETHNGLGVVLARQGKIELAAAHYAEAMRLDPGHTNARKNLEALRTRQRKIAESGAPAQ